MTWIFRVAGWAVRYYVFGADGRRAKGATFRRGKWTQTPPMEGATGISQGQPLPVVISIGKRIAGAQFTAFRGTLVDRILTTKSEAEPVTSKGADQRHWMWQLSLSALLVVLLYHRILLELVQNWMRDDNYSHGFFVPLFSGYVVWQERKRLGALSVKPSWLGLGVITGALGVLIVGALGAEFFLSRSSLVFLVAGLVVYFLGWSHFRAILFPWAFLFLMIPIPVIIFNQIAFPLQILASQLASSVLPWLGVPVLREGNLIHLPAMSLEVAQACSGIRSLVSLETLAIIYGYFLEPRLIRRLFLAIAAVPVAVTANALRVVGTGFMVHYWDPQKAEGFFHSFAGWVVFVLSLAMLFSLHGLIGVVDRWRGKVKP